MTLDLLQAWLGWCALLNLGVLLIWWLMIWLAGDLVFRLHSRWFRLTRERFDAIHYAGLAAYKMAIYLVFALPWLALVIVR